MVLQTLGNAAGKLGAHYLLFAEVYSHPAVDFKFPEDLIVRIQPEPALQLLGKGIPEPMGSKFCMALELAGQGASAEEIQLAVDGAGDVADRPGATGVDSERGDADDLLVEDKGDDGAAEDVASKKTPNFIQMIDQLLTKLDPLQFVKLIEKVRMYLCHQSCMA